MTLIADTKLNDLLGAWETDIKSAPALGGAYDQYSKLVFTEILGSKKYKNRLYDCTNQIFEEFTRCEQASKIKKPTNRRHVFLVLQHLLHSFAHLASYPGQLKYVSVSLNRNDYYGVNAQFSNFSYEAMAFVVAALTQPSAPNSFSLVTKHGGSYTSDLGRGLRTRLSPNTKLLDRLTMEGLVFVGHPYGFKNSNRRESSTKNLLQLKINDHNGVSCIRNLKRGLNEDEEVLPDLNKLLENLRIDFQLPSYAAYLNNWDYANGRSRLTHMSGKSLYRRFVDHDGEAGRLYGHWVQNCPADLRRYLTFNRKETIELDFSAMQLMLLYGMADLTPKDGDPYQFDGIKRYWMKSVLTKSVGANSVGEALGALRKEMRETAPELMKSAQDLFQLFWSRHNGVYHLLFDQQSWKRLQYLDSVIALKILKNLTDNGIACIPIHDSFIVQRRYQDDLENAMVSAFQSLFPRLTPILK